MRITNRFTQQLRILVYAKAHIQNIDSKVCCLHNPRSDMKTIAQALIIQDTHHKQFRTRCNPLCPGNDRSNRSSMFRARAIDSAAGQINMCNIDIAKL